MPGDYLRHRGPEPTTDEMARALCRRLAEIVPSRLKRNLGKEGCLLVEWNAEGTVSVKALAANKKHR